MQYKAVAKNENNSTETNLFTHFPIHLFTLKRAAFTLAEVLITLGIIGVVAALTIPTLITKYQDKVLINQTKKAFSQFQNGLALASQDNGTPWDNSLTFPKGQSSISVIKNLAKYFNGAQVCANASQKGCSQFFYSCVQSTPNSAGEAVYINTFEVYSKIVLADGTIFGISSNNNGCENTKYTSVITNAAGEIVYNEDGTPKISEYYSAVCAYVIMDVNGVKGPNQYGRDIYQFHVFKNKVVPNTDLSWGGTSWNNIFSGKEELVYTKYKKGQKK